MKLGGLTSLTSKEKAEQLRRGLISSALIALVLIQSPLAIAWGNEGHVAINRVAAQKIPVTMPRFLRLAIGEIGYLGPEPDRWRSPTEFALKNSQEPDHLSISNVSPGSIPFLRAGMSSIANSTTNALQPRTIPTTTFRSASACSPISRWKSMAA